MTRIEKRQEWTNKLEQWSSSGLSARAWCLENNVPYHQFLYWTSIFKETSEKAHATYSFIELEETSNLSSGITLECNGILVNITPDFDSAVLSRCLQVLRGYKC